MNETHIIISNLPDKEREKLLEQLKITIRNFNPHLKVTVSEPFLWLSHKGGHYRLYYSKCRYIETDNRCLLFHCANKTIRKNGKMSDILEKLPKNVFFRCNNSYIVNLQYISEIVPEGNRYNIHLLSGEILPLSRSRYQECRKNLQILLKRNF